MSEIETRTREALHDVVDGLDVTEADVSRMEADLLRSVCRTGVAGRRLGSGATVRRRGLAVAAVAMVVAAGGLALSRDEDDSTRPADRPASDQPLVPDELVGTWQNVPDSPWVWEFTSDGKVLVESTAASYLESAPSNTFVSRSGDVFTVRSFEGCDETWRVRTVRPGVAAVTFLRSSCTYLEADGGELMLERVSPRPYLHGDLAAAGPSKERLSSSRSNRIHGVWLHPRTGTLLTVGSPSGKVVRYVLDDDGDGATDPDQSGRVTLATDGPPVFRRDAADASSCVLAFSSVVFDGSLMTTTSPEGGCLPGTAPQTWVRVT